MAASHGDEDDFDRFWKWKLRVESTGSSILDANHIDEAYRRLCRILPRWKAYRPRKVADCLEKLRYSLENASAAYDEARRFVLPMFDETPSDALEVLWNELGRIKEIDAKTSNDTSYYVVAVCKPLMFLWGQTPAFDSTVRRNIWRWSVPSEAVNGPKWSFETWKSVMHNLAALVQQNNGMTTLFEKRAERKFGRGCIVPYGRFLDVYFYERENSRVRGKQTGY